MEKLTKYRIFLNKELVEEEKGQSEIEDLRQTPLDVDHHDAKPCSEQPENVVHTNVPSPSESVLTPSFETNESRKLDRAESKLEDSTKKQDERSSDIWTPTDQKQISGVSPTGINLADKKITEVEKNSEESKDQFESDSEQGTENNETDDRKKEESETDPDCNSEESAQDENKSEAGEPGPKKRQKQRKKGKEKHLKKQERKEKNKTIKESSETAVGDSNSSSKKKKPGKGSESSSTSATTTEYHSVMNVSYSLPLSSYECSLASGSEQQVRIGGHIQFQQPSEEGPESGSSVDPKPNQQNQADTKVEKTFAHVVAERPHIMTTRSKSDLVEITFCAIASKKFVENPRNKIYLRFALDEMGGFDKLWPTYPKQYDIKPVPLTYSAMTKVFAIFYSGGHKQASYDKLHENKQ